jgi:hypothetical protein
VSHSNVQAYSLVLTRPIIFGRGIFVNIVSGSPRVAVLYRSRRQTPAR